MFEKKPYEINRFWSVFFFFLSFLAGGNSKLNLFNQKVNVSLWTLRARSRSPTNTKKDSNSQPSTVALTTLHDYTFWPTDWISSCFFPFFSFSPLFLPPTVDNDDDDVFVGLLKRNPSQRLLYVRTGFRCLNQMRGKVCTTLYRDRFN